ncbi:hypothetical protein I4F81_005198 [Pyropia yezoensis]|uniref:Uncharacterized protein n=1 Tax=Pyropia yezoensis TaxID=2788 RepID=A0ACC3BXL0_PYRYE|nr:hypothetical protein I4F81_005198 [Neopyropia yezoensis]|eukprot:contig_13918_g3353
MPRRRPQARIPRRILSVRDGALVHLQDVAKLMLEEWAAVSPAVIAHCLVKAIVLPLAIEARILADYGDDRASLRPIAEDVSEVLDMMGGCALSQTCFGDGDEAGSELAVEGLPGLEEDPHAIEDTVDAECGVLGADD